MYFPDFRAVTVVRGLELPRLEGLATIIGGLNLLVTLRAANGSDVSAFRDILLDPSSPLRTSIDRTFSRMNSEAKCKLTLL